MCAPAASKRLVLSLYRDLLRYGTQLQYTDQEYFLSRIRREFRQGASLTDPKEIDICFKRGLALLNRARVV
ncbi:MIEF1 upstream open reading frame protein [Anopheles nili]|uniref:MIEF1 upstream open reading frame protein n=1 Tax=Anopheles nili TaxID=185578 RepID=UPI00237A1E83|nr:MIEF1 upstream open reading frame protein [Anopheles nili]